MTDKEFFDILIDITDVIYKECQDVPHDIGTKIGTIIGKHLDNKIFDAETFNTYKWNRDVMRDMAIESFKESDKIFIEMVNRLVKENKNEQFRKDSNMFVTPEEALITWNCLVDEQVSLNHLEGVLEATEKYLNDYQEAQKALDEFTWKELKADEKS